MKNSSIGWLVAFILAIPLAHAEDVQKIPAFTTESRILAVGRQDQRDALKRKSIRKEVLLTDVIKVVSTYRMVSKDQYLIYAHQPGVSGTLTLIDGNTYRWSIEPDYAAKLETADGVVAAYLLRPDLPVKSHIMSDQERTTPSPKSDQTARSRRLSPL